MIAIRFDDGPGPVAGRFIEVERDGKSINFGEWKQDGDDWLLELTEVAKLEEFVHLVQSQWEEFGCDDGVVTVKYPWAVQERMRELIKESTNA